MATKKAVKVTDEVKAIEARLKKSAAVSGKKWKKKTTFTSWSFSRYNDYKQCPLKAKLKHIDKIAEPPNEAMERGADIGRLAELMVKGKMKKVPDSLIKFKDTFLKLAAMYKKHPQRMVVEDQWGLTGDWKPIAWDNWEKCVLRVKIDVGHLIDAKTMRVIDWKTGKYRAEKREEYIEQLELYALSAMLLNPALEKLEAFLAYLDHGVMFPEPDSEDATRLTFTRKDIPRLQKAWEKRTRPLLNDTRFAPRPNDKCRWCHYRKENTPNLPGKKQLCQF